MASVKQEASAASCCLSLAGSSVLSSAKAQETTASVKQEASAASCCLSLAGSSVLSSAEAQETTASVKQEASAAPHWLSQVGSSVLSSGETQETRPPLNKRPVLLPASFLKLGALSLLLKPKRHGLHLTRGMRCTLRSLSVKIVLLQHRRHSLC
jgi:hypothetical protein